jgi:AraC-like DNA-binding protein
MEGITKDFVVILLSEIRESRLDNIHRIIATLSKTNFDDEIFIEKLNDAFAFIQKQSNPPDQQQDEKYFDTLTKLLGDGDFSTEKLFKLRDNYSWKLTPVINLLLPRPAQRLEKISVDSLNKIRNILHEYQGGEVLLMQDGVICILVNEIPNTIKKTSEIIYEELLNQVRLVLQNETKIHFSLFFSNGIHLNELKKNYSDFRKFYKLGYFAKDLSLIKPGSLSRKKNVHETENSTMILSKLGNSLLEKSYTSFREILQSLYLNILKESMNISSTVYFRNKLELLSCSVQIRIPDNISRPKPGIFTTHFQTIEDELETVDNHFKVIHEYFQRNYIEIDDLILKTIILSIDYISFDISLDWIADQIHVSSSYLSHKFKKDMGIAFTNYKNQIRVLKAQQLLSSTPMKIYEVAQESGFSDYRYFSQVFKKITDKTPTEYRDMLSPVNSM